MKRLVGLVVSSALVLTACASEGNRRDGFEVTPELAQRLGNEWPLTVDKATITCGESKRLWLFVQSDGGATLYPLNGLAKATTKNRLEDVWKDNPEVPGLKMEMWLTEYGNEKCGN